MAVSRNRLSPDPAGSLRSALQEGLRKVAGALSPGRGLEGLRCGVGLSGGRDSVVLLHALVGLRADLGLAISALHVHHGLSPNADRWATFCADFCRDLALPLTVERVKVDRSGGQGVEGAARAARHATFARMPVDVILLAHHAGDQAETLLFNLLRGSGLNGASAMAALRRAMPDGGPWLLRPWLEQPAIAIEAYRARFNLAHIDDESNRDTAFSRNFLRHEVLVPVECRFPGATGRLAGAARRLGEARALLADLADADLARLGEGAALDLAGLSALDPARRNNALRRWLELRAVAPGEDRLDELFRQIESSSPAAKTAVRCGAIELRVWRGRLFVVSAHRAAMDSPRPWLGEAAVDWGGGILRFKACQGEGIATHFSGALELRPRAGGERLRLRTDGPTRPVRLLFQESAVPPWERDSLPFLWAADRLVAIPGIGIAAGFAAAAGERGWWPHWEPTPVQHRVTGQASGPKV